MTTLSTPPDVPLAQVKWRVDSKPFNGRARFLPYLDAYEVARLFDQWVGPGNWSDSYTPGHGKGLFCHLSVKVGDEWVTKTDLGVPSNMEAEKGLVSDAFKRAGSLKWGVGGNVYRLPNVWAPVDAKNDKNNNPVAVPNRDTLPAIIAELAKRGFKDAAAADATNEDHDEIEAGAVTALPATDDGRGETIETTPTLPGRDMSPLPSFEEHDWLRKEIANLPDEDAKRVKEFWKQHSLPSIKDKDGLDYEQFGLITSFLDQLHEERERQVPASEAGSALVARAEAIRAKKQAPTGDSQ